MASFGCVRCGIATGSVINGPATDPLNVYEALEADGDVQIRA